MMSSHKKEKKRPSSSGAQMAMGPMPQMSQMPQMWPMFPPWNQMMPMGSPAANMAGPSSTKTKGCEKKPWDTSSDSSEDSDFVTAAASSKKKRKVKNAKEGEKKRGPGRPKKEETLLKEADTKIVQAYPVLSGHDQIAYEAIQECKSCRLWKGRIALQPCGHAMFCFSCMEKFKDDAVKLQRPGKCLANNCYEIITSWFRLYNLSPN